MSDRKPRKNAQKVLLSVTALAAAAGLAGVGTYANFTGSTGTSQTITSGTMTMVLGAPGTATNNMTLAATGFAPTDFMERALDLTIGGNVAMSAVELTTADNAGSPTLLTSDATNGLQIRIDSCAAPWTFAGTSPRFVYTCAGGSTPVLVAAPVVGVSRTLAGLGASGLYHLRVRLDLPTGADDTFQNLNATINHSFVGVQRAGIAQ